MTEEVCPICFGNLPNTGGPIPVIGCDCGGCRCDGCVRANRERRGLVTDPSSPSEVVAGTAASDDERWY